MQKNNYDKSIGVNSGESTTISVINEVTETIIVACKFIDLTKIKNKGTAFVRKLF